MLRPSCTYLSAGLLVVCGFGASFGNVALAEPDRRFVVEIPEENAEVSPSDEEKKAESPPVVVVAEKNPQAEEATDSEKQLDGETSASAENEEVGKTQPPAETVDLGTSTVSGKQTSPPRLSEASNAIGEAELAKFKHDDIQAAIARVPGVYARGEDGYGLRPNIGMRGVNPDRSKKVTLTEDGVLFGPAPYSSPAAYYFPLVSRMVGIEVYKGPATLQYGPQTVAGSINLVSRSIPNKAEGMLDLSAGSYLYGRAQGYYGFTAGQWGALIEGVKMRSDGFKQLDGGGNTGFDKTEVVSKLRWTAAPEDALYQEVEVKLGYSQEMSNETYLGITDSDFSAQPLRRYSSSALDKMEWERTQFVLSHYMEPAQDVTVETKLYRQDFDRTWNKYNRIGDADTYEVLKDPSTPENESYYRILSGQDDWATSSDTIYVGPNHRVFVSQGIQSNLKWNVEHDDVKHEVKVGIRVHYDEARYYHTETGYKMINGSLTPESGDPANTTWSTTRNSKSQSTAVATYLSDTVSWGRLSGSLGLRTEFIYGSNADYLLGTNSELFQVGLLPGGGLAYEIIDGTVIFVGIHRGYSPVAPGQAPETLPEQSVVYEGGVRGRYGDFSGEIAGFFNDYENLSDTCGVVCSPQLVGEQFNLGAADIYGFEASLHYEGHVEDWSFPVEFSYTYTQSKFLTSFVSLNPMYGTVTAGDELPYIPPHQLFAQVGVAQDKWGFDTAFRYVAAMREKASQGEVPDNMLTDAYATLDMTARYQILPYLSLQLKGTNILNNHYIVARRPFGARPGPPIIVIAGATLTF